MIHTLSLTSHLPASRENPPTTTRSVSPMVTMPTQMPALRRSPNPQRFPAPVPTRILPGQLQFADVSYHTQTTLSRTLVAALDRIQGVALGLPFLLAVTRALALSDAISQASAKFAS
jgi:hypothetical protein